MEPNNNRPRDAVSIAVVVILGAMVSAVVARMLFPPKPVNVVIADEVSGEAFPAAAALAMGERMGQSAEWTIATVLIIGSALVGLQWYQSERRYRRDIAEFEERLAAVESTAHQVARFLALDKMNIALGNPDQPGFVDRAIAWYRISDPREMKAITAKTLVNWATRLETMNPTLPLVGDVKPLRAFVPELNHHFPDDARAITEALDRAANAHRSSGWVRRDPEDEPAAPD